MESVLLIAIIIAMAGFGLLVVSPLMIGALFLIEIFFGDFIEGRRKKQE
jgi:hypothetical protein